MNLWFSLSGNKAKGRMKGLQKISEAYTFLAWLERSPLWGVNNLISALLSDQTDLHDKRHLCLTSAKPSWPRWQGEKRNICLKIYKSWPYRAQIEKMTKVQSVALNLSKRSLEMMGFLLNLPFASLKPWLPRSWIMETVNT